MLNRRQIEELIRKENLVSSYIDLDTQLTPNGFDLTAGNISEFNQQGKLDFSNKEREVPQGKEILPGKEKSSDKFGWWHLGKGAYKIKTNEVISLPDNLIALAFSRTSLLRMGGFTQHGVWDAGFRGRGEFVLIVENPSGIKIKQNARLAQLIFLPIDKTDEVYQGIYRDLK